MTTNAPDSTLVSIKDALAGFKSIEEDGFRVVPAGTARRPWCYTVGLADEGLPEIVVTDIKVSCSSNLIRKVANDMIDGESLDELGLDYGFAVGDIHPNHVDRRLFPAWTRHYGDTAADNLVLWHGFKQLVLSPELYCAGHVAGQADLSQPHASLVRRAERAHRRRGHLRAV